MLRPQIFTSENSLQYPAIHTFPDETHEGVRYLTGPGVVTIGITATNLAGTKPFLEGFDESLEYMDYLEDPVDLAPPEELAKFAGQLCYMSFGPKRTMNRDAGKYFDNIKSQRHGSVIEHPNVSFLFYGISRSLTHEFVRHRAGFGYSQLSQRYVMGKMLRFVERPEYQADAELHGRFIHRIRFLADEYADIGRILSERQQLGSAILSGEAKTDLRKKVNQAARSVLPNETEAPMVVTGNIRAWRHFTEMRASEHAEVEIRELAYRTYLCLRIIAPNFFDDYEVVEGKDGTSSVKTPYPKV